MFSDLYVANVIVAKFQESVRAYIPEIISLLSDCEQNVRIAGANALSKLSVQGKV